MLDLDDLRIGDCIWIKRYTKLKEKKKLSKGHQEGPAIIIKKTKTRVYALTCTSKPATVLTDNLYYIGKIDETYKKKTYVLADYVVLINKKNFLYKYDFITENQLNDIYKLMYYISTKQNIKHISKNDLKYSYKPGDEVSYKDELYIIYDVDKNYKCFKLGNMNATNTFKIGLKHFTVKFNKIYKLPKNKNTILSEFISEEERIKIHNQLIREYKYYKQLNGYIIQKGKNKYLVYEKNDEYIKTLILYKQHIYPTKFSNFSTNYEIKEFKVNTRYTKVRKININKFNQVIDVIKKKEEEKVKQLEEEQRHERRQKAAEKARETINKRFKKDKIIEDPNIMRKFLIVKRNKSQLYLLSLEDSKLLIFNVDSLGGTNPFRFVKEDLYEKLQSKIQWNNIKTNKNLNFEEYRDYYEKIVSEE